MRAIAVGGVESIEAVTSSFWALAPYGMVLLRLALNSQTPLQDALWIQANPATRRLVPDAHLFPGLRLRDILDQDKQEPFVRELLRWEDSLEDEGSLSTELTHGEGEDRVVFHIDAAQRAGHLMLWIRDITAERRETESLRRDRELFQRVIHCAPDAIFAKDLDGRYTLINPEGARAMGVSPADIIGHGDQDIFQPEDASATRAHDEEVLAARRPLTYEDEDVAGQRVWLCTKGVLRDEKTGAVTGLFGISRDITERKHLERALQESEARHRWAARATREVLWDWHLGSGEMNWSTVLGEVFGEAPEQCGTSPGWWRERIHPDDQPRILRALHAAMEGREEHWSSEYRFRRADGTYACVLERGHIDRSPEGRPERLIGAMMDVSEHKRREEESAREARLVERVLGIVSHDLGSPLAAIRLSAQMLAQSPNLTPAQHTTLSRIEETTRRMTRLTRQMLDSVRARDKALPVVRHAVDLEQVCRRVLDEFAAIYPRRHIQLTVEGDTQGHWDADRLAQVFSNLVGNAIEHGDESHPITIQLWDAAGEQRLEVNSHGRPIDAALLPHLFEPFRTGGRGGRRASGGVGLGLFIVREFVRGHQGEVEVRSSPEEGTTFTLRLPRHAPGATHAPGA
ncbi:PAS domain-containing sensor histidine kinase [Cystobacter fuscus]|uniref:histidine kinase n=1 Tax=Cystobacter fuscus TaxID=43 RepID=A0A250IYV5_9BACT|nr:PAS domain-containing sensor histidine kinase [Cystobacter fuscus]ATB36915.1 PAS domain-containing sensor histidine kinase [Cystobacter fuscus]